MLHEEEMASFECSVMMLYYSKMFKILNLGRISCVLKENATEYSRIPLKLCGKPLEANVATRSVYYRVHYVIISPEIKKESYALMANWVRLLYKMNVNFRSNT